MTLIVAMACSSFALLASDRQITERFYLSTIGDSLTRVANHGHTKTVFLDRAYVMGFAGLGSVNLPNLDLVTGQRIRLRMEVWLARVRIKYPAEDCFDVIAREIGDACEQQSYRGHHKFLATGWKREQGIFSPEIVTIENRTAPHTFYAYRQPVDPGSLRIEYAGGDEALDAERERFEWLSRKVFSQFPDRPDAHIMALRDLYQRVAARSRGTVGADCLITTIPRVAVPLEASVRVVSRPPRTENYREHEVSWLYHADYSETKTTYFPAFITPETAMVGVEMHSTHDSPELLPGFWPEANPNLR